MRINVCTAEPVQQYAAAKPWDLIRVIVPCFMIPKAAPDVKAA